MLAGLLNSGIQSTTNEGRSLNLDQSANDAVTDNDSANDVLRRSESRKVRRMKWLLLLASFILEGLSISFEQLSAPKKPIYAFMSMITASLGLLISIIELSFRVRENDMIISRLLVDALENFGFLSSTWQCICVVVQYVFVYNKKVDNPIKISILTLIFLNCAAISRLYNIYRGDSSTQQLIRGEIQLTSSGVEASTSLSNTTAIEETEPVVQDGTGVLIRTELRDDTTVHRRVRTGQNELHVDNEVELFKKLLSQSDVKYRLALPIDLLSEFPIPEGAISITFQAKDTSDREWRFKISIRRNDPNLKPILSGDWLLFVRSKGLGGEDRVILSRDGAQYKIRAERKIFEVWVNIR